MRLRQYLSMLAVAALVATGCSISSGSSRASPTPHVAAKTPVLSGIGIALKATATITFHAAGFDRQYTLDSDGNAANGLTMESRQAFLDLGSSQTQDLKVTVIGDGGPGAHLQGPNQVLAAFTDSVAKQAGIATLGQGTCTFDLTRFGSDGLAGSLDCVNVAPDLGSAAPVSFQATIDATPA